jgi:protein-tyrosine phosphatase
LTLQSEKENAFQIRDATLEAGLEWIWLPMIDGNPLSAKREREVTKLYRDLSSILDAEGRIYIHCAAGIHRTGMIAYGFLRFIGVEARTARETLLDLREVTARCVGEHRLSWGDRFSKS